MSLFQDYKDLVLNNEWNQDLLKKVRAIVAEDESKMEPFTLPSGVEDVKDAMDWMTNKRPKLLKFFCDNVYGRILPRPQSLSFEVLSIKEDALNNTAIRKEIRIHSEKRHEARARLRGAEFPRQPAHHGRTRRPPLRPRSRKRSQS